jgi:hypothetical protein
MSLYTDPVTLGKPAKKAEITALVNEKLTTIFFDQLSGILGSVPFVKFVIDRKHHNTIHFINDKLYHLHAY